MHYPSHIHLGICWYNFLFLIPLNNENGIYTCIPDHYHKDILLKLSSCFVRGPSYCLLFLSYSRLSRWAQKALVLLISPICLCFIAAVISEYNATYTTTELLINSWSALSRGVLLTMVDRCFFGSWMFTLFSFAVLPNWLTLWGITFCEAS